MEVLPLTNQSNINRTFYCSRCEKRFTHSSDLRRHELVHTGERPYLCVVCNTRFARLSNLRDHESIHVGDRPTYAHKCQRCDKQFRQIAGLRQHERIHTGECPFACTYCDKPIHGCVNVITTHSHSHRGTSIRLPTV